MNAADSSIKTRVRMEGCLERRLQDKNSVKLNHTPINAELLFLTCLMKPVEQIPVIIEQTIRKNSIAVKPLWASI